MAIHPTKITLFAALFLASSATYSQDSSFRSAWKYADLYENEQGDYLKLSGRLHADAAAFDASQGDYTDIRWRRFRFGFKGKYAGTYVTLEANFDLNDDLGDSYGRITDASLGWDLDEDTKLTVLKHSAGFTLDGKTSSKKLLTPQRNNLTNNLWFTAEYFTGASLKGKLASDWSYNAGIFASDGSNGISLSEASYFTLLSIGKNIGATWLWEEGEFRIDYVYNDVHEEGNTRDFGHVASFSGKFNSGNWHLWSDVALGRGEMGQSDIWGLIIMPA